MSEIVVENVSRWFGHVVAVNDVSMRFGPGVTGLLGPNGAGKTTLLSMMGGFLAPSTGLVTVAGMPAWRNSDIYKHLGLVPERELSFGYLTGRAFVRANAELHGLEHPGNATESALATVDLKEAADRKISTYSKGMRQRIKLAAGLVHGPQILLLDEPFNGVDPRQRAQLMRLLRRMGEEGHTVVFSSHILEEVEQLARRIEVMVAGRHAASGDYGAIRRLMTDRPVHYFLTSSDDRALASLLIAQPSVAAVSVLSSGGLDLRVADLGAFAQGLPAWARSLDVTVTELTPTDESLESVFAYLVAS